MNIIDWMAFFIALIIQILLFSKGHNFNKSFINFSALFVYFGELGCSPPWEVEGGTEGGWEGLWVCPCFRSL